MSCTPDSRFRNGLSEAFRIRLAHHFDPYLATSELCKRIYRVADVEKKHRVAVLRAMQTLVDRGDVPISRVRLENEKSDDEWFNGRRPGVPYSSPLRPRKSSPR